MRGVTVIEVRPLQHDFRDLMEGGGRGPRWSILAVVALLVLPGRLAVQHPLVGMRCMEPGTRQMEVADSIGRSSASHFVGGSRLLLAGVRIQAGFSSCLILSMRGGAGVEGPAKEEEAAGMDDDEVMRDGDGDQEEQEEEAGAAERELAAFDDDDDGRPGHGGEDDDSDSNKRKDPTEWRDGFESGEDEFEEQLLNYESETDPDLEYMRQVGEDTPRERALEMVGELRRRGQEAGTPGKMAIDAGDSGQQGPIPVATQPGTPAPSASSRVVKPVGADAGDNGLEGQLLVPDDVENVPTAVKAAAWVEEGEDPVGIFVRKGIHRWDAEIALYPRYDLDMPPGVEFIEGMVQNTSKHYVYQTQMETLNSTRKRGRLELSGDPGALMWGRWLLEVGSEGHFKNVQLLSDPVLAGESQVPDITAATFEAVSSNVSFSQCGLRCVKGVCLRVAEESNVRVIECAMGGLGQDERSKCASCVTVWDQSQVAVGRSIMSDGMMGSAGVRVCGEAEVAVRGSRFERLFTAVCLHHRGSLSIIDSVFHNQTHSALFAGGEHDNGTRLTLQGCTIDSTVWADDGRPGKVIESKNVLMGGQSSDEMEFKRLKEETEEMERRVGAYQGR